MLTEAQRYFLQKTQALIAQLHGAVPLNVYQQWLQIAARTFDVPALELDQSLGSDENYRKRMDAFLVRYKE